MRGKDVLPGCRDEGEPLQESTERKRTFANTWTEISNDEWHWRAVPGVDGDPKSTLDDSQSRHGLRIANHCGRNRFGVDIPPLVSNVRKPPGVFESSRRNVEATSIRLFDRHNRCDLRCSDPYTVLTKHSEPVNRAYSGIFPTCLFN